MSKRSKYAEEEKYNILMDYDNGVGSIQEICIKYNISISTFYQWRYKYEKHGLDGLKESRKSQKYSKEIKERALKDYLSVKYSQTEISKKYGISNRSVFKLWINKYNGHREITATPKGMRKSMTNGRTTSLSERIEIVQYCIAHNNDYHKAAETYQVSYNQVYQWVRKYESGGENALQDARGRKKPEAELTPEDRIRLEMKRLEAENERLRAENAFLKKLEELERRRY
ncbi:MULTISPECIES: helix-turn-helix domain-containing protein [unclassified Clostridium]|uniref:helix-turn-helix domain-containing protein n=1 Tax=unclassified Clostridium TaxID=2614128 RepID=UPI0002980899|nr:MULTISPECIES: helix-turn-helix domain-containing protein [unclassified Clostridium]EKQ57049.1 MAG: transposase [Clostridium sp. Maddingley MBC34-26]